MPDWFYRTVSQPLLFKLPVRTARDLALGFMGRLARLPLGPALIDFMGHMRPDPRLRCSFRGIDFPTRVGLGPNLDQRAVALPALARFGFGFLEMGPVTVNGHIADRPMERLVDRQALWLPDPPSSLTMAEAIPRAAEASRLGLPLLARLASSGANATDELQRLLRDLSPHAQLFTVDSLAKAMAESWSPEQWAEHVQAIITATTRPVLLVIPSDLILAQAAALLDEALPRFGGVVVDGSIKAERNGRILGSPVQIPCLEMVRQLRPRLAVDQVLIAAGGVHEPAHALALRAAGADLVQVDTGLIYSGPGLPKRINDALLFEATRRAPAPAAPADRPAEMTWFWTMLMGTGMLVGSILALIIAATRVILPYDEAYVNMSRAELDAVNPRLLAFMAHDRVSLAGTMVAVGIMYIGLSWKGIRQGLHWARQAVFFSAFTGFASFFLFLGFGYLDPFHLFVTVVLMQFLLFGVHSRLTPYTPAEPVPPGGDWAWRCGLWGQLCLIVHGCGLLGGGVFISTMGATGIFVHEDLDFMQTTAAALEAANSRLLPLVAHDRATFGGMLLASGWVFLLPALWGFRGGSVWLWRTMLVAGLSAYGAGIGVHFAVGYTHLFHLLPAFSGLWLFSLGMILSYPWLGRPQPTGI